MPPTLPIDLRLGDGIAGLEAVPNRSVDHVVTDPPFDARAHRVASSASDWRSGERRLGALPFDPLEPDQLDACAAAFARVARRWILVFSAERQIEAWASALERHGARFVRLGLAVRTNPRPQHRGDRPGVAADPIVIAHAAGVDLRWNGRGRPGRWDARAARWDTGGRTVHPTQKAVPLLRALLEDFTDAGELICDPFAGSGTTAVACEQSGRAFLGWEIDPEHHATAIGRLGRAHAQVEMFG